MEEVARISIFRAFGKGVRGRREASSGKALRGVEGFRKLEKPVDGEADVLHNLVSLLRMQRRRTKRCRVGVGGTVWVDA